MPAKIAYTRSSVNLLTSPDSTAEVLEALGPDEILEIIEETENLVKVRSKRWQPQIEGYLPKASLALTKRLPSDLPKIKREGSRQRIAAIFPELKANEFEIWLHSRREPYWIDSLSPDENRELGRAIRNYVSDHRIEWASWLGELKKQGRLEDSLLYEWLTQMNGGRDMWSIRPERIFDSPSERASSLGWVSPKDILHWNGNVSVNNNEPKYKKWYQVELIKLDRYLKGWYKASLLEEYIWVEPELQLDNKRNAASVFDLSKPILRFPNDDEIKTARNENRRAAQYIDVSGALGMRKIHHNLCGEFCVAALNNMDVIPLLKRWRQAYHRAQEILEDDTGTGVQDLQNLLRMCGLKYELFRIEPSVAPITPGYLTRNINMNRKAIIGVGIDANGIVSLNGNIRHWVVLEDFIQVGFSGWSRLYNPFHNREEVYPFHVLFDPKVACGYGIWVKRSLGGKKTRATD